MILSRAEKHAAALLLLDSPLARNMPRDNKIMCALETRGVVEHNRFGWAVCLSGLAVAEKAMDDLRKEGKSDV